MVTLFPFSSSRSKMLLLINTRSPSVRSCPTEDLSGISTFPLSVRIFPPSAPPILTETVWAGETYTYFSSSEQEDKTNGNDAIANSTIQSSGTARQPKGETKYPPPAEPPMPNSVPIAMKSRKTEVESETAFATDIFSKVCFASIIVSYSLPPPRA